MRHLYTNFSFFVIGTFLAGCTTIKYPKDALAPVSKDQIQARIAAYDGRESEIQETLLPKVERYISTLLDLKKSDRLPGLSVAFLADQELIYADGFGYANIEDRIPASAATTYKIASLTKPISSVLLLDLVERELLDLDAPIRDSIDGYDKRYQYLKREMRKWHKPGNLFLYYLIRKYDYQRSDITVRHHFTHTSEGNPGEYFRYNGQLFSDLSSVFEKSSGRNFRKALNKDIILKLSMDNSLPSHSFEGKPRPLENLAILYKRSTFGLKRSNYPYQGVSAAAGIVSSVEDLAKFDIALDQGELLSDVMLEAAWTPAVSNEGETLPYGLGWCIQDYKGHKIVWHYGWQIGSFSALYIKVPDEEITMILLVNSPKLGPKFYFSGGDILASPYSSKFLSIFIDE